MDYFFFLILLLLMKTSGIYMKDLYFSKTHYGVYIETRLKSFRQKASLEWKPWKSIAIWMKLR